MTEDGALAVLVRTFVTREVFLRGQRPTYFFSGLVAKRGLHEHAFAHVRTDGIQAVGTTVSGAMTKG